MDPAAAALGLPTALERALASTPEMRLLLLAARPAPPDLGPAVAGAVADGLDPAAFLALARAHRVVPHVARALREADGVPEGLRQRLARAEARNALRQLQMAAALGDVLGALGEAGVPSLPLKGPTLATWLFGDPARRTGADLDVLVAPGALADAVAAVGALGYGSGEGSLGLTAAQAAVVAAEFEVKDASFWHAERRVRLELHWQPFRDRRLVALRHALEAGLTVDHPDPRRPAIGPLAGAGAFVLVHGAFHGYRRLSWLVDAAGLAVALPDDAWAEALELARADGVEGAALLGPVLASRLLGVPVPAPLRARVRARRRVLRRLVDWCETATPDGGGQMRPAVFARTVGLYDTAGGRARRVWGYLARPSEGEVGAADLDGARWRRRLARPLRLAANTGRWAADAVRPRTPDEDA